MCLGTKAMLGYASLRATACLDWFTACVPGVFMRWTQQQGSEGFLEFHVRMHGSSHDRFIVLGFASK